MKPAAPLTKYAPSGARPGVASEAEHRVLVCFFEMRGCGLALAVNRAACLLLWSADC